MEFTVIIIIVAFALYLGFIALAKRSRFKKLLAALQTKQWDTFNKLVDSSFTKFLFPRFNLEFLKLNAAIIKNKKKEIEDQFKILMSLRMSKKQKEEVYMRAFNYYVGLENKKAAKEALDVILTFDNEQMKKEASIMYDIYILKNANNLESMLLDLEDLEEHARGVNEYLISLQYENLKDKKNAKKYLDLSKKHMEMLDNMKK